MTDPSELESPLKLSSSETKDSVGGYKSTCQETREGGRDQIYLVS